MGMNFQGMENQIWVEKEALTSNFKMGVLMYHKGKEMTNSGKGSFNTEWRPDLIVWDLLGTLLLKFGGWSTATKMP